MSPNNSDTVSRFETVASPPWRITPHVKSYIHRHCASTSPEPLPDPTHISPFLYPASSPSRRRTQRKHEHVPSKSECIMDTPSSSTSVQATFRSLTMGWSFRMQLQDLDKQRETIDSGEEDEDEEKIERWDSSRRSESVKLPVHAVETRRGLKHLSPRHSRSRNPPLQLARSISRCTDETSQNNYADYSDSSTQSTARLARTAPFEPQVSSFLHRQRSNPSTQQPSSHRDRASTKGGASTANDTCSSSRSDPLLSRTSIPSILNPAGSLNGTQLCTVLRKHTDDNPTYNTNNTLIGER